jgi:hypothetical protein
VICSACLPTTRLLLIKVFPVLDGSSKQNQRYRQQRSDDELKIMTIGGRLRGLTSQEPKSPRVSKRQTDEDGESIEMSVVGGSGMDADDLSLVEKNLSRSRTEGN